MLYKIGSKKKMIEIKDLRNKLKSYQENKKELASSFTIDFVCSIFDFIGESLFNDDDYKLFGKIKSVNNDTSTEELQKICVSDLVHIYNEPITLSFLFVMENNTALRVSLISFKGANKENIFSRLVFLFIDKRMRKLKDKIEEMELWIPVKNRFELLDL